MQPFSGLFGIVKLSTISGIYFGCGGGDIIPP